MTSERVEKVLLYELTRSHLSGSGVGVAAIQAQTIESIR